MSEKEPYKQLKRNTLIIAIGNLGSKAIAFILAPLYSFYLSTSQYGTMDLITTTANLLMPFFCLDIYEATFRFTSDSKYEEKEVFSASIFLGFITSFVSLVILLVLSVFINIPDVILYALIASAIDVTYNIVIQYARGKQKMLTFALSGVINSVVILVASIIFLILLKFGLKGWIFAYLIAKVIAILFVLLSIKGWKLFSLKSIKKSFFHEAFAYCLPLLPTTSMWWIMNASDRYMIAYFVGASANGIYAVANKLPSILSVFENVFYQAWQTTAINTIADDDRDSFYSSVFNKYYIVLSIGVLGLLVILKKLTLTIFESSFSDAWMCTSILVVSVMVHALGGMLGIYYTVFKNTRGALLTSIIGASVNTILNFFLIPIYGINVAAVTTLIGYFAVVAYRWFDIKKYITIKPDKTNMIFLFILLIIQIIMYYSDSIYALLGRIVIFGMVLIKYRRTLFDLLKFKKK